MPTITTKRSLTLVVAGLLATVSADIANASQPSYACQGNLNAIEYKVCTTPNLATADRRLAEVYDSVKARIRPRSDVPSLIADQKRWLATRDACWSKRCIARAYVQRIDTLESYAVIRDD